MSLKMYIKTLIIAIDIHVRIKVMVVFAKEIRLCPFNYARPESSCAIKYYFSSGLNIVSYSGKLWPHLDNS